MQGYLSNALSFVTVFKTHDSSAFLLNSFKSSLSKYLFSLNNTGQFLSNKDPMSFARILRNATGNFVLNSYLQPSAHPLYTAFCSDGFAIKDDCLDFIHFEFLLYMFLSPHMMVNITFDQVKFISGSSNFLGGHAPCELGQLLVVSWLGKLVPSSLFSEQLSFCGHLSRTSIYPMFQSIFIQMTLYPSTLFQVKGQFVTQDKSLEIFTSLYGINNFAVRDTISYAFQKQWTLSVFRIEMCKLMKIYIHVHSDENIFLVHDGPGYKSPVVQLSHNTYSLTSFQAFIASLQPDLLSSSHLSFTSLNVTKVPLKLQNSTQISLPDKRICSKSQCVLSFHSLKTQQVNLTVLSVIYVGEKSEACKFGGFTTAQHIVDKYTEHAILCETISHKRGFHKSFYSTDGTLLAILYQFLAYSSLKLRIRVENTICKYFHICPCEMELFCAFSKQIRPSPQCSAYQKHLQNGYKLRKLVLFISHESNIVHVSPHTFDPCLVVQIARIHSCSLSNTRKSRFKGLSVNLLVATDFNYKKHYLAQIELDQKLNKNSAKQQCMYSCGFRNSVTFLGKTFTQMFPNMTGKLVEGKAPTHIGFMMRTTEPLHANNWIELQLKFENIEANSTEERNKVVFLKQIQQVRPMLLISNKIFVFRLYFLNQELVY